MKAKAQTRAALAANLMGQQSLHGSNSAPAVASSPLSPPPPPALLTHPTRPRKRTSRAVLAIPRRYASFSAAKSGNASVLVLFNRFTTALSRFSTRVRRTSLGDRNPTCPVAMSPDFLRLAQAV